MTLLKSNSSIDTSTTITLYSNKKSQRFSNRNLLRSVFSTSSRCHRYDVRVGDYCGRTTRMLLRTTASKTTRQIVNNNKKLKDKLSNRIVSDKKHIPTLNNKNDNTKQNTDTAKFYIGKIKFGQHTIDSWFLSPYPVEYCNRPYLYICEFCFKYMKSSSIAERHKRKCNVRHPPGNEIYRQENISIFEVDGSKNKMYCQNLCLLTKLFLNHKTLFYDVEPFLFYIMTETDQHGCHFVGYFSKEKESFLYYNVSCVLILPVHQRKGYGQYLIDFSYLLTKQEKSIGSPEKPLSQLGMLSYQKYWKFSIYRYLSERLKSKDFDKCSIEDISSQTGMTPDDVVSTLQQNDMIILQDEQHVLHINEQEIQEQIGKENSKQKLKLDEQKLIWKPFQLPQLSFSHEDDYDSDEDEECCSITTN